VVVAVFIVYQQIENHLLQPLIYGRTVQLSPLMVLISILLAGSIAGVIGALIAIPIAVSLQVVVIQLLAARRERLHAPWSSGPDRPSPPAPPAPTPPPRPRPLASRRVDRPSPPVAAESFDRTAPVSDGHVAVNRA